MPTGSSQSVALSRNPLDDMMDLFNQSSMAVPTTTPTPAAAAPPTANAFAGLDSTGFGAPPAQQNAPKPQQQSQSDDLLGLF